MRKSSLVALLLAVIPGGGHLYLGKKVRGPLYFLAFFGMLAFGVLASVLGHDDNPFKFGALFAFMIWAFQGLDMIVTLIARTSAAPDPSEEEAINPARRPDPGLDRSSVVLMSLIPGLGHFQLGLMNRGMTLLFGMFGLAAMIVFVTILTHQGGFIVFLLALPALWIYGIFDVVQLQNRRERGEALEDKTFFEDLEDQRESGKKSKALATFLAIFPGAGHLYLGLQRRGIQLMAAFLFTVYFLDALHLSFFLFLIPLLWCFSFFDALQMASKLGKEPVEDVPVVDWLINHQKWVGYGLTGLGLFYLMKELVIPLLERYLPSHRYEWWFDQYFQTAVVSLILIAGGIKLLAGSKPRPKKEEG